MTRYPLLLVAGLLAGCVGGLDLGSARFACANDQQCGSGARCVDSVCVAGFVTTSADASGDTAVAIGFGCAASVKGTSTGDEATFKITVQDGKNVIVVEYAGMQDTVPLPDDVIVDESVGPLEACCENPCCPPFSP